MGVLFCRPVSKWLTLSHFSGQYYTDDQYLNIYSFSLLYKWLHQCSQMEDDMSSHSAGEGSPGEKSPAAGVEGAPKRNAPVPGVNGSPKKRTPVAGVDGSPKRRSSVPGVEGSAKGKTTAAGGEGSPGRKTGSERSSTVSRVLQSLVSRSVDYCFRVMDQCERSKLNGRGGLW